MLARGEPRKPKGDLIGSVGTLENTDSILSMTEHGAYVWPSYAVVTVVLLLLVIQSLRALKRTTRELEQAEQRVRAPSANPESGE